MNWSVRAKNDGQIWSSIKCATGFFQWRASGANGQKWTAPLVNFAYSKIPAAQSCATGFAQWRTTCKLVILHPAKSA
jgi:hypothetical protein